MRQLGGGQFSLQLQSLLISSILKASGGRVLFVFARAGVVSVSDRHSKPPKNEATKWLNTGSSFESMPAIKCFLLSGRLKTKSENSSKGH